MTRLVIFLVLAGLILTGVGIRFTDQGLRKMGIGMLIIAAVVMFMGKFTNLQLGPTN